MNNTRMIEIIAVVIIATVLLGEVIVYTSGTDDYDSNVSLSDDGIDYNISVKGSQSYNVIAMENSMAAMAEIYVYFDSSYISNYESEEGPIGSHTADQEYFIDQLIKNLEFRGISNTKVVSAEELATAMTTDIINEFQKGLVVVSGALPDTIYSETSNMIFQWLSQGGRLYWAGNLLGLYSSSTSGLTEMNDHQNKFFGINCLNEGEQDFASKDVTGNTLRYDLSLKNNRIRYAIDSSILEASGKQCLAVGYEENGYSSIVFTEYGKGMICVLGGDLSRNMWSDLAQIISANITYVTSVIGTTEGTERYGNVSGSMNVSGTDISVYVYLGGYYPVYARYYDLKVI